MHAECVYKGLLITGVLVELLHTEAEDSGKLANMENIFINLELQFQLYGSMICLCAVSVQQVSVQNSSLIDIKCITMY